MSIHRLIRFSIPFLLIFSSWAQADSAFSRVYVFGDSLSDTGNATFVKGLLPQPPFFMGSRISNGPVAVEILAQRLGLDVSASREGGTNFAVAGASAVGIEREDLDNQLDQFLASHGLVAPADALYVVFLGGNDIRGARGTLDLADARAIVKATARKVGNTIETLAGAGARNFLLVNAPDVGVIPETRLIAEAYGRPDLIKRTSRLSKLYRRELHRISNQLEDNDDDIRIVEFDLFKFLQRLLRKADRLGFSNTSDPCFFTSEFDFNPECNFEKFDQYVFFDEIHPSGRVHALAGEAMFEALELDDDDDHDDDD